MLVNINSDLNNYSNLGLTTRNIVILQDLADAVGDTEEENLAENFAPIGIANTFADFLGIKIEICKDKETGTLYIKETNQNESVLVSFSAPNDLAQYVECLEYLAIYCKINNLKISLKNLSEDRSIIDGLLVINNPSLEVTMDDKTIESPVELFLDELKDMIKNKAFEMDINAIFRANLSKFETRKMIACQYGDVSLTEDEIKALSFYKAGYYSDINALLRGLILPDWDKYFYENVLEKVIDCCLLIDTAMKKFTTDRPILLIRGITNLDELDTEVGGVIRHDNFVSTSIMSRLFKYTLEGVSHGGYLGITIPKGSHFIPMDLVTESRTDDRSYINNCAGSTSKDEGEFLLPMCNMEVTKNNASFMRRELVYTRMTEELDLKEILIRRIEGLKEDIISHTSEEKYEELLDKVKNYGITDEPMGKKR